MIVTDIPRARSASAVANPILLLPPVTMACAGFVGTVFMISRPACGAADAHFSRSRIGFPTLEPLGTLLNPVRKAGDEVVAVRHAHRRQCFPAHRVFFADQLVERQ